MAYTDAILTADLDFLAAAYRDIAALFGDGSGSTSLSARLKARLDAFEAALDIDAQKNMAADLCSARDNMKIDDDTTSADGTGLIPLRKIVDAIKKQVGSINSALASKSIQIHPYAKAVIEACAGGSIAAANVFAIATAMGSIARGAGSWNAYVAGTDIDKSLYAPCLLELYVPQGITIGAASCVMTVSCKKADDAGTIVQHVVTVPNGSAAGTAVQVGGNTDKYIGITAITGTGGTSGDQLAARSKQVRSLPW